MSELNRAFAKAQSNLLNRIGLNTYPGRVLAIGLSETREELVQLYAIMGRSKNSRNRVFGVEHGRVYTEVADPSLVGLKDDLSLVIYSAMREMMGAHSRHLIVSNGHQTDAVFEAVCSGQSLEKGLAKFQYEEDPPNYTPRITAVSSWRDGAAVGEIAILRKSRESYDCDRDFYKYEPLQDGFGQCITTYECDGNPLPSYVGEPFLVALPGDIKNVFEMFWGSLNEDNLVSLAVKFTPRSGPSNVLTRNKYERVPLAAASALQSAGN
jgi:IMP cyclohydrolase